MGRILSVFALLVFLTFFGAGFVILMSFIVAGVLCPWISSPESASLVLSLILLLPLAKRFFLVVGLEGNSSRKLALIVGLLTVLVFYVTVPGVWG